MRSIAPKAEWTIVSFGDVVKLSGERASNLKQAGFERFVGLDHLDPGELKIRRWGDTEDGITFTTVFRPGHVLFGKRRAYQRKVAIADFSGVCSGDIYVFEPKDNRLLNEFLPFICQTDEFFEHAIGTSAGSLSPRTNWTSLSSYEFALPAPTEQKRIATVLRMASDTKTAISLGEEAARSLHRAASSEWFDGILRTQAVGERLDQYLEHITDRGHKDLPILSVTIDGRVVRRDSLARHVSDESGDEKYIRAQAGDIAYNTMRLWQGAIGIVEEEGLISPAYTVMRRRGDRFPVEYFWEILRSPAFRREYRRLVRGVASDRWRVYFKDLATIRVSFPETPIVFTQIRALAEFRVAEERLAKRAASSAALLRLLRQELIGS